MSAPKKPARLRAVRTGATNACGETPPPRRVRRKASIFDAAPPDDRLPEPPALTWPMQLELVRETSRLALRQCNSAEAVAVGEFMLNVGVKVLEVIGERPIMVIEKDTLLDQLIARIHQHAEDQALDIADVIEALLLKLDTRAAVALN